MSATIVDGNKLAAEVIEDIKKIKSSDYKYRLGIVLVGDNPASLSFIRKKEEVCKKVGVELILFRYPEEVTTRKLRLEVGHLQKTRNLDGLVIQLPLPKHISADRILDGVQPEKDVDCLCSRNIGRKAKGLKGMGSPLVLALNKILNSYEVGVQGKRILIIGAGRLIGKPIANYFINKKNTVVIVDKHENNLSELSKVSDIIIIGVGKRGLLKPGDVKKGVVITDCGFSMDNDGQIVGDIESSQFQEVSSLISPVPNGMGPLTTAFLVKNVIESVNTNSL